MTDLDAVLLPVGSDLYAVPIDRIEEVVASPTLTRLVTAPPHVLGLFNLRGQIVPLIDTAALLGGPAAPPATFAVVLQSRQGLIGLAVTEFPAQTVLSETIGPSELPGTVGSFRMKNRVVVLLEPDVLLAGRLLAREGPGPRRLAVGPAQPGGGHPGDLAVLTGFAG